MDHGSTTTRGTQTARLIGVAGLLGIGIGGFLARARAPLFPDILDLSGPDPVRAAATRGVALAAAALLVLAAGPVTRLAPGAFIAGAAAKLETSESMPTTPVQSVKHAGETGAEGPAGPRLRRLCSPW